MTRPLFAYSLSAFIKGITGQTVEKVDAVPDIITLFSEFFTTTQGLTAYWQGNGKGAKLWEKIVYRYSDNVIFTTPDALEDSTDFIQASKGFFFNFWNIWSRSHDYFDKLIDLYESKENALLDKLKRENILGSRFNDTPQDFSEEYFNDDAHATTATVTKTKEEIDSATPIQRLKEIQEYYQSLFDNWIKKFDSLFVSELNYKEGFFYEK